MGDDQYLVEAVGGGTSWFNNNYPARSCLFPGASDGAGTTMSSFCSGGAFGGDMGGYGWLMSQDIGDIKGKLFASNYENHRHQQQLVDSTNSVCDSSVLFPADQIQENHQEVVPADPMNGCCGGGGLIDASTLQMMGFGLSPSSSASDWNQQTLFAGSTATNEVNYNSILQEDVNSTYQTTSAMDNSDFLQKDWNSLSTSSIEHHQQQQPMNSSSNNSDSSTITYEAAANNNQQQLVPTSTATCFPMNSPTSENSICASSLIQNLLNDHPHQPQVSDFSGHHQSMPMNNKFSAMGVNNYNPNNTFSQQQTCHQMNGLLNGNMLTTSTAAALEDIRATLLGTATAPPMNTTTSKLKRSSKVTNEGQSRESISVGSKTSNSNEQQGAAFKRPRIETPSSLPTFKVRKEKLGDRITALQQLVSPFGKTDTASVLQEAIEYIKFLHDQVNVLRKPYLKSNGVPAQNPRQQQASASKSKEEGPRQDLRTRGLCLVPLSSTFPVASETPVDFWTPTFGATSDS